VKPDVVLHCLGRIQTLLRDLQGHFDQRRTILRDKTRDKHLSGSVNEVERAAVRIGDTGCTLDNQTMQIGWPQIIGEGFAQAVEKIEHPVLLDLKFFPGSFEYVDCSALPEINADENEKYGDE
jgi:hypothetical protein